MTFSGHPMSTVVLARMISDFCRARVTRVLPPREAEQLRMHLVDLIRTRTPPPRSGAAFNMTQLAVAADLPADMLEAAATTIRPALDAMVRGLRKLPPLKAPKPSAPATDVSRKGSISPVAAASPRQQTGSAIRRKEPAEVAPAKPKKKTGVPPRPVVEFPAARQEMPTNEPEGFKEALRYHMERHGDTRWSLFRAVILSEPSLSYSTIYYWLRGRTVPRTLKTRRVLKLIERRYRLPEGHLAAKLPNRNSAPRGHDVAGVGAAELRRLAWHLPDDFASRSLVEREQILEWVRTNIITGATDYRLFHAAAMKQRYALRFPDVPVGHQMRPAPEDDDPRELADPDLELGTKLAPARLSGEMSSLIRFKTATLTSIGFKRNGVWGGETAAQKLEHLGLLFGAMAASPSGAVQGLGVPLRHLSLALLAFPATWDWYIQWRERRRGFYTAWEVDMLSLAASLVRAETGWLRQSPQLVENLTPIPGLVSAADINAAKADWAGTCEVLHRHATARARELQRVVKVHRDPFEPILPILESDSPVGEYRKIANEILARMPDENRYPVTAAEAVRSLLLIRLGLHLGVRQKNLRQLLVKARGQAPSTERQLADRQCGELRWSTRDQGWEVLIPAAAFKNATSTYFGGKPFRLILPDLGGLYDFIEAYLERHRQALLRGAQDPGTFFVKTVKTTSTDAAYNQTTFYEAWRLIIQRYGIYNPYTGRGAIKGLLPHGPHSVRDVLATHILKKTGSFEQASYAIQDTPDTVANHYARFLPQDKAALAAQVLNQVWEAA
ncbi:hypothetical protein AZA_32100 [Nitrospirillum viridazoti Y2]|nr:hypothetical protein AZA_32100 [Nitrospirillum amazonense Y2]